MMHTIKIFVDSGVVIGVDGLPDGFDYEIIDKDAEESAIEWIEGDNNVEKNI